MCIGTYLTQSKIPRAREKDSFNIFPFTLPFALPLPLYPFTLEKSPNQKATGISYAIALDLNVYCNVCNDLTSGTAMYT